MDGPYWYHKATYETLTPCTFLFSIHPTVTLLSLSLKYVFSRSLSLSVHALTEHEHSSVTVFIGFLKENRPKITKDTVNYTSGDTFDVLLDN